MFYRYASEGIKAACDWAYKGATEGTVLEGWKDARYSSEVYWFECMHLLFD